MKSSQKLLQALMVLVLAASLLAPAALAVTPAQKTKLQPELAALAAEAPEQMVRVIVRKAYNTDHAEELVEQFGGQVLQDLSLINAFAAVLPVDKVTDLASLEPVANVTLDAPVISTGKPDGNKSGELPENVYLDTLGVRDVWAMGYTGEGVTVAVIDSGLSAGQDFRIDPKYPHTRVKAFESFNTSASNFNDATGHGTHVTGIIGGNGALSDGLYTGIAPLVDLISLKISDENGMAYESDTVAAMQWVFENKELYNIRVVNLSIQSSIEQSYHDSPLAAAAEILWFNGVVVVAATGNWNVGEVYPLNLAPGNDPFIITVGAADEKGTSKISDDFIPNFSAWGYTLDGFIKPEIFAPGVDIISVLAYSSDWDQQYPDRVVDQNYFRISGTSMATPMVSGAVALLLQAEPDLTPDQVKYRVMHAHNWVGPSRYLSVSKMLTTPTTESANQEIVPHMLLAKMALIAYWANQNGEEDIDWGNIDWEAVNWTNVDWEAVDWNAVDWNAVNWTAVNWTAVNWTAVNWTSVNWNAVNWTD